MESQPQNSDFKNHPKTFTNECQFLKILQEENNVFQKKQVSMIRKYNTTTKQCVHVLQV